MIILTTYPPTITFGNVLINVIFWGLIIHLYRNRDRTETHTKLWYHVKIFLAVLVATLGINYAKKSVKDWWGKD